MTMTRFYTRRGDSGKSVLGSKKLSKDDPVFAALGGLDELNSWLGVCVSKEQITGGRWRKPKEIDGVLRKIQESLFIAQAEIAAAGMGRRPRIKITKDKTEELEKIISYIDNQVPEITKFVIAGGSELSADLDYARAIARRAERDIMKFSKKFKVSPELKQFTNRLSSVLFALARYVNYQLKIKEDGPTYK